VPQSRRVVSIVVPVYYNAASLPHLEKQLCEAERELEKRGLGLELIFVDDGSGDGSSEQLMRIKAARPATKVVRLTRNFGAVAASKTGFRFVTGDAFMPLSADLQEPIEQVWLMADEWLAGHKFVISARAKRGDPPGTRIFARLYYHILELLAVKGYPGGGYDLMLMDKSLLPYLRDSTKNTNPNVYAFWLGFPPRILQYDRRERKHGRSRWTFTKKLLFLIDTVVGFSARPLLSGFGFAVALLSLVYGGTLVATSLLGKIPVQGFAALGVMISFFSGLILVMLGVLGEYLWRVADAINNRPEAVIDREFL
jgi:glycosyltransferase involved in cell wall biosynthesis